MFHKIQNVQSKKARSNGTLVVVKIKKKFDFKLVV